MKDEVTLITQRVVQNNQEFLIGVFNISEILRFTRYTEYTILGFDEEDDNKPIVRDEIQRKLIPSKINSIVDFLLNDPLAIFPTNLVISIPNHVITDLSENEDSNLVQLKLDNKVLHEINKIDSNQRGHIYLSIIDGQHRVKGIENTLQYLKKEIKLNEDMFRSTNNVKYSNDALKFRKKFETINSIQLPVTFFIDPVLEYQAMIFSTINRTQTKVPPDLVYSLFGLTERDSPQKTVLNIVNTLNGRESSPFYKRVRLAGAGSIEAKIFFRTGNPILSQTTVVKSILSMICENQKEEEKARHVDRSYFKSKSQKDYPFRYYYATDQDDRILIILFCFFNAVRRTYKSSGVSLWDFEENDTRKPKNILQTTIGFLVLLNVLKLILSEINENEKDKIETYERYLEKAKSIDFKDNNDVKKYPFANKTKNLLFSDIGLLIWGEKFNTIKT